jgi:hypothetical protein
MPPPSFSSGVKLGLFSRLGLTVMGKGVLFAHGLCVLISCCFLGYLYASPPQIAHVDRIQVLSRVSMGLFAGIGMLTGFWLMAKRRGKNESVVLATSTVVSVFLLIIALMSPVQLL